MPPRLAYRQVEAVLYGLGGPPDSVLARPAPTPVQHQPVTTSGAFAPAVERADLTFASRRLAPEEREVLRQHYVLGVRRYPTRVRRPIVAKLLALLDAD